jgi:hypothetical protein
MNKLEFNNEDATVGMNESNPIGTLTLVDSPFNITFNWKEKTVKVELENGEDVLRLATIFSDMLTTNKIAHKITHEINS